MSDFARVALWLFAAVAPIGGLRAFAAASSGCSPSARAKMAAGSAAFSLLLVALAVAGGEPLLDLLDISPENFQLAAGLAMLPLAFRLLGRGVSLDPDAIDSAGPGWRAVLVPLATPLLAGPAALVAAVSYGTRDGVATTLGAAALVLAGSAALFALSPVLLRALREPEVRTLGRLTGALLVVVAVEMLIDGVQSV